MTMTSTLGSRSGARKGRVLAPAFLERRWKPGQSGNPSGHAAEYGEVNKLARQHSVRAMERLGELMESEDERVAAVACNSILDRAFGKPEVRRTEPTDNSAERLSRMTDEQKLEEAKALSAKVRAMLAREREREAIDVEAVDVTPEDEAGNR